METLTNIDWQKVLKGAAIAGAGAALTYLSSYISGQEFGTLTPVITAALSVAVNFFRKLKDANSE